MVASPPLSEIRLTDEQFLGIVNGERNSPPGPSGLDISRNSVLGGYCTITIVYSHCRDVAGGLLDPSYPEDAGPATQILIPKNLNLVIINERVADIREVLNHFKTSRISIRDNLHEAHLATHEIPDDDNNISIIIWNGRICTIPPSNLPLRQSPVRIAAGFGKADLYVNNWIEPGSFDDVPMILGQFCRDFRPHTLGFHMLSPRGAVLASKWHLQGLFAGGDNTLLRRLSISGISSDGFLRLLQCSAIEIWCIKELKVALLHDCFWDWRIFEKETWPIYKDEGSQGGFFADDEDLQDSVVFPKLTLARLIEGRIQTVDKGKMEAQCQIAHFRPDFQAGCGRAQNDIECYAGRSLSWASLEFVKVHGKLINRLMSGPSGNLGS